MQCAVIEFARNVCGLAGANSTEFDADRPHPVIDLLQDQQGVDDKGGTMRLGAYPCRFSPARWPRRLYGTRPRSASATATATSSTTPTATRA